MVAKEKKRCFDKCLQPLANKSVKSYELCVVVCSRYCICCIQIIALGKAMNQESFFFVYPNCVNYQAKHFYCWKKMGKNFSEIIAYKTFLSRMPTCSNLNFDDSWLKKCFYDRPNPHILISFGCIVFGGPSAGRCWMEICIHLVYTICTSKSV